jgi:hypothetical protein
LLLIAAGFGTVAGAGSLLAETFRNVSWSLLVCVGVALGRVAARAGCQWRVSPGCWPLPWR